MRRTIVSGLGGVKETGLGTSTRQVRRMRAGYASASARPKVTIAPSRREYKKRPPQGAGAVKNIADVGHVDRQTPWLLAFFRVLLAVARPARPASFR